MSSLSFGVVEENLGENIFLPRVAASVRNIPVLAGEGVTLLYKMALVQTSKTLLFVTQNGSKLSRLGIQTIKFHRIKPNIVQEI